MMAGFGQRWRKGMRMRWTWMMMMLSFASAFVFVSGERGIFMKMEEVPWLFNVTRESQHTFVTKAVNFLWQSGESGYQHVWPVSSAFSYWVLCLSLFVYLKKSNRELGLSLLVGDFGFGWGRGIT